MTKVLLFLERMTNLPSSIHNLADRKEEEQLFLSRKPTENAVPARTLELFQPQRRTILRFHVYLAKYRGKIFSVSMIQRSFQCKLSVDHGPYVA